MYVLIIPTYVDQGSLKVTVASRLFKGKSFKGCILGHCWVTPILALMFLIWNMIMMMLIFDL